MADALIYLAALVGGLFFISGVALFLERAETRRSAKLEADRILDQAERASRYL